ncbi:MAG: RNA polymerase sigma factor [Cytophagales bacterium]|nr:RNA polymerase sigma factor [Cytophagales bacterium]
MSYNLQNQAHAQVGLDLFLIPETTVSSLYVYRLMVPNMIQNLTSKRPDHLSHSEYNHILDRCMSGNEKAQNELFKLFFSYAKSVCLRYSSNAEDAKDILNKGFMKVFKNLEKYDSSYPFKAWLRTIMVNTALNHYRDNKKFNQEINLDGYEQVVYDEDVIGQISAEEILALVQKLPPAYRTVFVMHVVDGYNHREIGEIIGINEGTSRSNYSKARIKLQVMIQKNRPDLFAWGNS